MSDGGSAQPVVPVTTGFISAAPALRVAVVSDGRPVLGGASQPVYVVTDNRPTQGNTPIPVVLATGVQATNVMAGPAIPVVVVSGSLNPIPPFVPTDIPGLRLWLKADALAVADGALVTTWPDSSGNGNDGTGATAAIYKAASNINSKPAVRFDGVTNDKFLTPSFLGAGYNKALSYFMVSYGLPTSTKVSMGNNGPSMYLGRDTNEILFAGNTVLTRKIGYSRTPGYQLSIEGLSYDGTTARYMSNGANSAFASAANYGVTGALAVGNYSSGGFTFAWDIGEVLLWNAGLTLAQMQQVAAYLSTKYAVPLCTRKIVIEGDSLAVGFGATGGNTWAAQMAALYGNPPGDYYYIQALSGSTIATATTRAATQVDTVAGTNIVPREFFWCGTNDMKAGATGAATYAAYVTYCTNRRAAGLKVIAFTVTPRSDAGTPVGFEAERQTFNTSVRANWATFADALADVAANTTIGDAGDENNTTYYVDKCHMTNAGYAIVAGITKAALDSIP